MSGPFALDCPDRCVGERMDVRNQRVAFCAKCAAIVNLVTGAAYNRHGQFLKNVIAEMLEKATCSRCGHERPRAELGFDATATEAYLFCLDRNACHDGAEGP